MLTFDLSLCGNPSAQAGVDCSSLLCKPLHLAWSVPFPTLAAKPTQLFTSSCTICRDGREICLPRYLAVGI